MRPHPQRALTRQNLKIAKKRWPDVNRSSIQALRSLTETHALSIATGDLILLDTSWYVTNAGLLRLARRGRCVGMHVEPVLEFSQPHQARWAFKATVFKSVVCRGFVGYGDADPSNVSSRVHGAEMRVAETRAVNRALRKAYGIGICSVEEMGSIRNTGEKLPPQNVNRNGNGSGPKVRDRLCQIIRQHKLDPELVK